MKNILNRFLLITLVTTNSITPVFGNWRENLTLENCKTELNKFKQKTKTFLTNKKNIKPAILLTISLVAARNSINNRKEANKLYNHSNSIGIAERKLKVSGAFKNAREASAKEYFETSIFSGIISFVFGAWGLNSLINSNK